MQFVVSPQKLKFAMPLTFSNWLRCFSVVFIAIALNTNSAADKYDVYLLAGQSNMDGRGQSSDLSDEQQQPIDDAIIFYRSVPNSSNGWQKLAPGFSVPPKFKGELPSPTFGPELGFARSMLQDKPGRKLALIKGSKGGTSLRADWKPGNEGDADSQGPRYRDFIKAIELATSELRQRGDEFIIRGLLWHQGESDSKSKTSTYQNRLKELIVRIREDVGIPELPVVVGEVFDNGERDRVRAAIQAVAAGSPSVGLVSSEGTQTLDPGTHFDAASQLVLGQRYAAAMQSLPPAKPQHKPTVVCFGDSITNRGYPALLGGLLKVRAINAGVGGNTTSKALRRIQTDVLDQNPEVVIVMFGTNDSRIDNAKVHVPIPKYKANLNAIIDGCKQAGSKVVLCTLPPIESQAYFTRHDKAVFDAAGGLQTLLASYQKAAREVAEAYDVPIVDLHLDLNNKPEWLSPDGVHPSLAGNAILAEQIADTVSPLLAKKAVSGKPSAQIKPEPKPNPKSDTAKPNVLFISVDDLNDWVGCLNGSPDAKTPNIDRLAQQSVLFNNAHCQVALCNASRVSVMTGLYASTSGVYGNTSKSGGEAYHQAKHMPVWFQEHGYRTMCMGKIYHNDHGKKAYWNEIGPKTLRWGPEPPNGRQFTKRFGEDAKDTLAWAALDIEEGGMPDEQIAAWGIEQLNCEHDKPFFLSLGFYKPHTPMTAPKRFFDRFDRSKLTLPEILENDLDDVPNIGRKWVLDRQPIIAEDAVRQYSPTYRRELVHAYHACVALIDDCIGQVLTTLDNSPHADNTVVVLWSDHGWHLGEKYHWRKWMPWEESTRSLMIVRNPKSAGNGKVCSRTVGLIDIYPTLADLCGLQPPQQLQGLSFESLLDDPSADWQRPALTSTKAGNHTVRSERWRYIRYVDGSEELYDHKTDSNEWHNIANQPQLDEVKQQHAEWIDRLTAGEKLN